MERNLQRENSKAMRCGDEIGVLEISPKLENIKASILWSTSPEAVIYTGPKVGFIDVQNGFRGKISLTSKKRPYSL